MMKPLLVSGLLVVLGEVPAMAQQVVPGTFALARAEGSVAGQMVVTATAPLTAELTVTFSDASTGAQITDFTEELTQELHVLAVDSSLTRLVHEHVETATPEGVFATQMQFPAAGTYHIFADAVPEGRGQQVLRFDVAIGSDAAEENSAILQRFSTNDEIAVTSGDYDVRVDASELAAERSRCCMSSCSKAAS